MIIFKAILRKMNAPRRNLRGAKNTIYKPPLKLFYHPDCTVGIGISPIQLSLRKVADFTAGGEFHSAPKQIILLLYTSKYDLSTVFLKNTVNRR